MYWFLRWDMSVKAIKIFYISWRKCLRQLYRLPYRTHNILLYLITEGEPINFQLHLQNNEICNVYYEKHQLTCTVIHKIMYVRNQVVYM